MYPKVEIFTICGPNNYLLTPCPKSLGLKANQKQLETIKSNDILLYQTTTVNFQGFTLIKLNIWTKFASRKYLLQMTRRVLQRSTNKL